MLYPAQDSRAQGTTEEGEGGKRMINNGIIELLRNRFFFIGWHMLYVHEFIQEVNSHYNKGKKVTLAGDAEMCGDKYEQNVNSYN